MFLNKISVVNFKSFESFEAIFDSKIVCFTGKNGVGKTNLIDAIYHLSYAKSYFNSFDTQNIRWNEGFYVIQANLFFDGNDQFIYLGFKRGDKKVLKRNQKEYPRLSDHVGLIPMVVVTPSDSVLINGGSEERRRFMDLIISQFNPQYLQALISYNHILSQRNTYLKECSEKFNDVLIQVWDSQLCEFGNLIFRERNLFIETFFPIFLNNYKFIAQSDEQIGLNYLSQLKETALDQLLWTNRNRDKQAQYTTAGIHKDELEFLIWNHSLKRNGSQGQQKTFLLALKLAQFFYIHQKRGVKPLLLLDDIFDKLDPLRVKQMMALIAKNSFGQIFITDTDQFRVKDILNKISVDFQVIEINEP